MTYVNIILYYKRSLLETDIAALSLFKIKGVLKPTIFSLLKSDISSLLKPPSQPITIDLTSLCLSIYLLLKFNK